MENFFSKLLKLRRNGAEYSRKLLGPMVYQVHRGGTAHHASRKSPPHFVSMRLPSSEIVRTVQRNSDLICIREFEQVSILTFLFPDHNALAFFNEIS